MMQGVLSGMRVLDFGRFIAAPCCAALLGDLGAEVIRVEKREGGEDRWIGPIASGGEGAMFMQNNRGKLSLTLDMSSAKGRQVAARLIGTADVVVANFPEKTLGELGLDYPSLRAIKSDIILTSISAFGSSGPYRDRLGFDAVGQLMSGAASRTGSPDQPVRTPVQYVDVASALAATVGTLAAIMHRRMTGEGQRVEASLLSTALTMTSVMMIEQAVIRPNRPASLNRGQQSAPNDIFSVKDGWILVQGVGQPIFRRWAKLMGVEEWTNDPRFSDDAERGKNWQPINERMQAWCKQKSKAEALEQLERARIPAYPVNTLQDALEDPQVRSMGYLHYTDYPGLPAPAPIVEAPFRLSAIPPAPPSRPPLLGEHTQHILAELSYSESEIAALAQEQII
ncbi:MAG: CoA transferase [Hyphomonadaceae bacterium]|nr:CoA transferase [Hyphomonadaceae bacterium]